MSLHRLSAKLVHSYKKYLWKIAQVKGVMFKIKNKVDCIVLCMVYNSLVLPFLSYCCEIWGNTYASRLHELIILQKRVIRVIQFPF